VRRVTMRLVVGSIAISALALSATGVAGAVTHRAAAASGTEVKLGKTSHGLVLVGPAGRTLYDLTADSRNHSSCGPLCRAAWPPLMTSGRPRGGIGVVASKLGQTATHQVTYNGRPLYYYAGDSKPGQTNGEKVHSFGGAWYLVNARGDSVK
jgi:predicted lipoprotein with Yx(FWY)xxD motif